MEEFLALFNESKGKLILNIFDCFLQLSVRNGNSHPIMSNKFFIFRLTNWNKPIHFVNFISNRHTRTYWKYCNWHQANIKEQHLKLNSQRLRLEFCIKFWVSNHIFNLASPNFTLHKCFFQLLFIWELLVKVRHTDTFIFINVLKHSVLLFKISGLRNLLIIRHSFYVWMFSKGLGLKA